jgi:hypothetical protein
MASGLSGRLLTGRKSRCSGPLAHPATRWPFSQVGLDRAISFRYSKGNSYHGENMSTLGQEILTTAVEGGIGYWFQITDARRTEDLDWVEITGRELSEDESGFDGPEHTIKASTLEAAARVMIRPDYGLNPDMKDNIARMLRNRDATEIDSDEAEVIVQQATFGKIVYG